MALYKFTYLFIYLLTYLLTKRQLTGVARVSQQYDGVPDVASRLFAEHRLGYLHR